MKRFLILASSIFLVVISLNTPEEVIAQCCGGSSYSVQRAECIRNGVTGNYSCNRWSENRFEPCTSAFGSCVYSYSIVNQNCSISGDQKSCSVYNEFPDDRFGSNGCFLCNPPPPPPPPPSDTCNVTNLVGDNTCNAGTCGACSRRTGIRVSTPNGSFNCSDVCVADASCCGAPPPPPPPPGGPPPPPPPAPQGTIRARAVVSNPGANACSDLNASTDLVYGSNFGFTAPVGVPRLNQPASSPYVQWSNRSTGNYTLDPRVPSPPPAYTIDKICWADSLGFVSPPAGQATAQLRTNAVLTYTVGLAVARNWFQIIGGNVHSNLGISVDIPTNEYLISTETGQHSAVASYTSTVDLGAGTVSSDAYIAQDAAHQLPTGFSYYSYYLNQYVNPTSLSNGAGDPATGTYLVSGLGNLTVSGTWNIASGQSVVVFVPGNLTISTPITVAEGGFLSFIVNGNVVVTGTVGLAGPTFESAATVNRVTDPHVTGIFIVSGQLQTGTTAGSQDRQLILGGTFVANQFSLQRDLEAGNSTYPGELFVFRPDLWNNAPSQLKEIKVNWQEINP